MGWHYAARRSTDAHGYVWWDVVESYSEPFGYTVEGMRPGGETREELVAELQRMLDDLRSFPDIREDA